jgi:hypothetical protein
MDFARWLRNQWDRAAAVAAAVLGGLALLLGWLGVSRSTLPTQQIPYLASGGLCGLFALGAAATLWLSADLRDEWRKLDQIHQDLVRRDEPVAGNGSEASPAAPRRRERPLRADTVGPDR